MPTVPEDNLAPTRPRDEDMLIAAGQLVDRYRQQYMDQERISEPATGISPEAGAAMRGAGVLMPTQHMQAPTPERPEYKEYPPGQETPAQRVFSGHAEFHPADPGKVEAVPSDVTMAKALLGGKGLALRLEMLDTLTRMGGPGKLQEHQPWDVKLMVERVLGRSPTEKELADIMEAIARHAK
jgi:hypothetical protein